MLFRIIGERALEARAPAATKPLVSKVSPAPLTNSRPAAQHAISVPALPEGTWAAHSFIEFLREKDFIRPLSAQQIADLRKSVPIVQLLELWRPDRSREERGMRPLRLDAVDARHEAGPASSSPRCGEADQRAGRSIPTLALAAGTRTPRGRSVIRRLRAAAKAGSATSREAGWSAPASARSDDG